MKKLLLMLLVIIANIGYSSDLNSAKSYAYGSKKIDSLDMKISPLMENKEFLKVAILMLEKGKLFFHHGMYINALTVLDNAVSILNKVDEKERGVDWSDSYVECLNWKGTSLSYMSDFDQALECYIIIEKYNKNNNNIYAAKAYNGMGMVFGMSKNDKLSEEYYKKALAFAKKANNYNLFPIYSNIGAMFMAKREFDSAMIYFLDAHKMAITQKDRNKELVSLQALALVNSDLGKTDLSLTYYNEACDIAIKDENYTQLAFLKCNMTNLHISLKDYSSALVTSNEALKLSHQIGLIDIEAKSLRSLSQIYEHRCDYKKSLEYIKAGLKLSDSIFNHELDDKLLKQKADFDLYRIQSEQALIENGLALELANRKINNMITWFLIVLIAIILCVVSMGLRKQYKVNKKLNDRIEDIQTNDESIRNELQEVINTKSQELTSASLLLVKFNELSYLLGKKLKILKANLSQRSKDIEVVKEMEELISQFVSTHNFAPLKQCYEQVSPEFYEKLDILYPDLTSSEKRLCGLISMDLSTKEIALLMDKSINNIEVTKSRIRKKMNVNSDTNLIDIL